MRSRLLSTFAFALALALPTQAAIITVDSSTDDGVGCTLREAAQSADSNDPVGGCAAGDNMGDEIRFSVSSVTLTQGQIEFFSDVIVRGPVTLTAAPGSRVVEADGLFGFSIQFFDVTFRNGRGDGGGIYISGNSFVNVTGGAFIGNAAPGSGGAIWVSANSNGLNVSGVDFVGNQARGDAASAGGGAIYTDGASITVLSSTFTDNRALGTSGSGGAILNPNGAAMFVQNTTFTGNRAQRAGGAVETVGGYAEVTNGTFEGNTTGPNPGNGGAVHGGGSAQVVILQGSATQNRATEGGAFWISSDGTLSLSGVTLDGNIAEGAGTDQGGGGVYVDGGALTVTDAMFTGNRATGASASGGAIFVNGGSATLTDATLRLNRAQRSGGAIEVMGGAEVGISGAEFSDNDVAPSPGDGGAVHLADGTLTLASTIVSGNYARNQGGALWVAAGAMLTDHGSVFSENTARGLARQTPFLCGGAVYVGGGTVDLTESMFTGNRAHTCRGGAVAIRHGEVVVEQTRFSENRASGYADDSQVDGGAIAVVGEAAVTISTSEFIDNQAQSSGGAIVALRGFSSVAPLTIEGSAVTGNFSVFGGGGLYAFGGTLEISTSVLSDNRTGLRGSQDAGGALLLGRSDVTIRESLIWGNSATGNGGGIDASDGSLSILNTTIHGNTALRGGGLFALGSANFALVEGSTLTDNQAGREGGGLRTGPNHVRLRSTIVAGNTVEGDDPNDGPSFLGTPVSGGFNIVDDAPLGFDPEPTDRINTDPMLGPLADNGGPTRTRAPLPGSPAIDTGDTDLTVDQRGYVRADGMDDVGAFEVGATPSGDLLAVLASTSLSTAEMDPLTVVPNPLDSHARATFTVSEAQVVTVTLYDVMGRRVQEVFAGPTQAATPVTVEVDGGSLAAGVYVLVLQGETVRSTRQVTVAR